MSRQTAPELPLLIVEQDNPPQVCPLPPPPSQEQEVMPEASSEWALFLSFG